MNLLELCRKLGELAKSQELVRFSAAGSSLGEINPLNVDWYPLFFIIPSGTHTIYEDTTRYDLTLYYVDRLLEDNTNTIDIFSSAIENLKNILVGARSIPGIVNIEDVYTIRNFMPEKLNDRLAGAYAQVRITVINDTTCYVEPAFPEEKPDFEG